jgi:hypothetical protein
MSNKILLPEDFKEVELPFVTDENRRQIFRYCADCRRYSGCLANQSLMDVENRKRLPYRSGRFMAVDIMTPWNIFSRIARRVVCLDYESPQLKIPGISLAFCEGVERLIEFIERERKEYLEDSSQKS